MAREAAKKLPKIDQPSERVRLVQKFLASEISPDFELIGMLSRGIAVHNAALSDEVRTLVEWLAEEGDLRVLCATTTIAQGINFPVSSVFLASTDYKMRKFPFTVKMPPRDFWNLAGRAGRMNQDSVGVVGIAEANRPDEIVEFVIKATDALVSRLVTVVAELDAAQSPEQLLAVINQEQWEDYRCYVNHLVREIGNLEQVLSSAELSLRNTYGYRVLQESREGQARAQKLLEATKQYARKISANPGRVALADMTGFSFEGVGSALHGISTLEREIAVEDFSAERLFGNAGGMADFYGIMLRIPQLARNLTDLTTPGKDKRHLADITKMWVEGRSIQEIATSYFQSEDGDRTRAITEACRAIYRNLINNGTWGISALSRLSGIDFDALTPEQKRRIDLLPAMIYHGVRSEEGVLMRMNGVPRSIAENMGHFYRSYDRSEGASPGIHQVRQFLEKADIATWNQSRPSGAKLTGQEYKELWRVIAGDER